MGRVDGRSHPPSFGFAIGLLLPDLPEQTWKAPAIPPGRLETPCAAGNCYEKPEEDRGAVLDDPIASGQMLQELNEGVNLLGRVVTRLAGIHMVTGYIRPIAVS